MLYANRKRFSKIGKVLGKIFKPICSKPNVWTIFGLMPAIITLYFLVNGQFIIASMMFALTAVVDLIDGSVAREAKRVTRIGAYLDTVVDRITEFIVLLGLFVSNYPVIILPSKIWVFLLFFGSLMTTYVKAAAFEKKIVKKEVKGGLLERGERMILIFLIIVISSYNLYYSSILIAVTSILTIFTMLQRFLIAIKQTRLK